ncbi:MAG: ATPase domain-containing protein [Acidilobaceae archaeon]
MKEKSFVFGIEHLDEFYKGALRPGMLITIAGHPGAGKTTLALIICLANILRGHRCLFVSTQEDESKLREHFENLGLGVSKYIETEELKFVKVPMPSSDEAVDTIVESIATLVLKHNPSIVVVDSISSLVKILADIKRRALLQNFFSGLAKDIEGLVIVTVEVPLSTMYIEDTGDIEFVSDAIFVLKHLLVSGTLSRRMEIRKLRGHPISIAEIPFSFVKGSGIAVACPTKSKTRKEKRFKLSVRVLDELSEGLKAGEIATIITSPLYMSKECATNLSKRIASENSARVLLFSLVPIGQETTSSAAEGGEVVVLSKDPITESFDEIAVSFQKALIELEPDVVVTFGLDVLFSLTPVEEREEFFRVLAMNANLAKNLGLSMIRLVALQNINDPIIHLLSQLSDLFVIVGDGYVGIPEGQAVVRVRGALKNLKSSEIYVDLCKETS